MTFGIITAVVASVALVLSLVQFLNRHRPYVCVTALRITSNQSGLNIEVEVGNLGEIPAKGLHLKATQPPYSKSEKETVTERSMGAIFPTQTLRTYLQLSDIKEQALMNGADILVRMELTYRSPFSFNVRCLGWGIHRTYQPLFVDQQGWGASAVDGSAEFR